MYLYNTTLKTLMYKKYGVLVVLLILMAITVNARITGYQIGTPPKEVDVAAGWNLVSFPKVTIKSTALGDLQPAIYQFKDAKWERFTVQQFEPNTAYFMDFMQARKIKIPLATSHPNVQLKQGWNAIGVSVDVKIKDGKIKSTGQEYALKNKVTALYVFNAEQQKWNPVTINDDVSLVPGKGYLLYSTQAGELTFEKEAPTMTFTGDDFEDGDYTKNPEWKKTPETSAFVSLDDYQLHLERGSLYTSSSQTYGTWEFDIPVDKTKPGVAIGNIYFISESMPISNYFSILDSSYYFFWRGDGRIGINKTMLTQRNLVEVVPRWNTNKEVSSQISHHFKITRSNDGKFTLFVDNNMWGEGRDNELQTSKLFVIFDRGVFDNIELSQEILPGKCKNGKKRCVTECIFNKRWEIECVKENPTTCKNNEWLAEPACSDQQECNPRTVTCEYQEGAIKCEGTKILQYKGGTFIQIGDKNTCLSSTEQLACKADLVKPQSLSCKYGCNSLTNMCQICIPNKKRCDGKKLYACKEDGSKEDMIKECVHECNTWLNECRPAPASCQGQEKKCEGNWLRVCDKGNFDDSFCGAGCNPNTKECKCNPGDVWCDKNKYLNICSTDGKTQQIYWCNHGCKDSTKDCNFPFGFPVNDAKRYVGYYLNGKYYK